MSTVSPNDKKLNRLIAEAKAQKKAGLLTEEQFQEVKKFYHLQKDDPPEHLMEKYRKEEADRLKQERSRPFQQNQPAQERHRLEQERLQQERYWPDQLVEQERLQQKQKYWEKQEYDLIKASHEAIEELNLLHAKRLEDAKRFLQEQLHAMHIEQQKEGRRF
jgi:hypothetical protein